MKVRTLFICLLLATLPLPAADPDLNEPSAQDKKIRDRYETILLRNPFQKRAFDRVYDSYALHEGIDRWIHRLRAQTYSEATSDPANLILGQIYARQFNHREATRALEAVKQTTNSNYRVLLGTLHYKSGRNEPAIDLLSKALDGLEDAEERARISRLLGNLYLRLGQKDEAIAAWKRLIEQTPKDVFAQLELATVYEENLMWPEAIEVYETIIKLSPSDPYRRCRSWRSIGAARLALKKHPEAIAAYEEALNLVSPGNWLFEDLKSRLIGVYQDIGDLPGFIKYLRAKLESAPNNIEFRDLLADTLVRQKQFQEAEMEYQLILEHSPRHAPTLEKLIALYRQANNPTKVAAVFEKLIEFNPRDSDYLRRLGAYQFENGKKTEAKQTWKRIIDEQPTADQWAELGAWFEAAELTPDAEAAFGQAVELRPDPEWILRLADLRHQLDQKDAAKDLWLSLITPESGAAERVEIATILENHAFPEESARVLTAALAKDPDNLDTRLALARNYLRRKLARKALPHFEKLASQRDNEFIRNRGEDGRLDAYAHLDLLNDKRKEWETELAQSPNDPDVMSRLAQLYSRSGQGDRAIDMYERRVRLAPENNDYRQDLANAYLRMNKKDEAIAAFSELVKRDPPRARGYLQQLISLYLGKQNKTELIATARKIVSLAPADPEARLQLAQAYAVFGESALALQQYRHLVRLAPNEPNYLHAYGEALGANGKHAEAGMAFRKMYATATSDEVRVEAVCKLTAAYRRLQQVDELIAEFRRNISNTPRKYSAYVELAAVHEQNEQPDKALDALEAALNQVEDRTQPLRSLIHLATALNDVPKVRRYYEMLLAEQGAPTAAEYETLGRLYVKLGDFQEARNIWRQMDALAGQDTVALTRLASVLQRLGFAEQYLDVMGRVLDRNPYDYRKRYEYALTLGKLSRPNEALEQLLKILELGEPPPTNAIVKITRPRRRATSYSGSSYNRSVRIRDFLSPRTSSYSSRYASSWQGSFKEFRPQLLVAMLPHARRTIGDETFLDFFRDKIKKNAGDLQTLRDLALIYRVLGRHDDRQQVIEAILAIADNEPAHTLEAAAYHARKGQDDEAIKLLSTVATGSSMEARTAQAAIVALQFKQGTTEGTAKYLPQLLAHAPSELYSIGSHLLPTKHQKLANKLLDDLVAAHTNYSSTVSSLRARYGGDNSDLVDKMQKFRATLLGSTNQNLRPPGYVYPPITSVYVPRGSSRSYGYSTINGMRLLPSNITRNPDYQQVSTFTQLLRHEQALAKTNQLTVPPIADALWQQCMKFSTNAPKRDLNRLVSISRLLVTHFVNENQFAKAEQMLTHLIAAGDQRLDWFNAQIHLLEKQTNYAAMYRIYDEMLRSNPKYSNQVTVARAGVALLQDDVDRAAAFLATAAPVTIDSSTLYGVTSKLAKQGKSALALKLLNNHLKKSTTRSYTLLSNIASIHAQREEWDQAIAHATEAWERYVHYRNTRGSSSGYFSPSSSSSSSTSIPYNSYLQKLYAIHEQAGSEQEFLNTLEQRLAQEPKSVQLHVSLAQLYQRSNDDQNLTRVLEALVKLRPDLLYALVNLADSIGEQDEKRAKDLYQTALKRHPNAYSRIQSKLRSLMRRLGQQAQMAQLDAETSARISDRYALRNLASGYLSSKQYDRAIATYQRALKLYPDDTSATSGLANSLAAAGRDDEAFSAYTSLLKSRRYSPASGSSFSVYLIRQMVELAARLGRLDELAALAKQRQQVKADDQTAAHIHGFVALQRKDFDRAYDTFSSIRLNETGYSVSDFLRLLPSLKNPSRWLRLLEKNDYFRNYQSTSVADAYLAAGEIENTLKALRDYDAYNAKHSNGDAFHYYYTLSRMCSYRLWDAAESYALTNRLADFKENTYARQSFDQVIATHYALFGRFTNLVHGVFAKKKFSPRDNELISAIIKAYKPTTHREQRLALLQTLLKRQPKNNRRKVELARLYLNNRQYDAARALLASVTSNPKANVNQRWLHADTYRFAGRTNEAIQVWVDWLKQAPRNARFRTEHAVNLERAGRYAEALAAYQRAVEVAKDAKEKRSMLLWKAKFERRYGRPDAYLQIRQQRFEKTSDRNNLGYLISSLETVGDYETAVKLARRHPDLKTSRLDYELLAKSGDLEAAIDQAWDYLIAYRSSNRDYAVGRITDEFKKLGLVDELLAGLLARIYANQAGDPEVVRDLPAIAHKSLELERPQLALDLANELLKSSPTDRQLHGVRAQAYLALQLPEAALKAFAAMPPSADFTEEARHAVTLAGLHFELGQTNQAERILTEVTRWSDAAAMHRDLGRLCFQRQDYARAAKHFQRVIEKRYASGYQEAMTRMIQCAAATGQFADARHYAREIGAAPHLVGFKDLKDWIGTAQPATRRELLPTLRKIHPGDHKFCTMEAALWLQQGDTNRAVSLLAEFFENASPQQRENHGARFTGFVVAKKLDSALTKHLKENPKSALLPLAIQRLAMLGDRQGHPTRKHLIHVLTKTVQPDPEPALRIAALLHSGNEIDAAEQICRRLLNDSEPRFQRRAAVMLHQLGRPDGTQAVIDHWLSDYPGEFLQRPELTQLLGPHIQRDKLSKLFQTNVPYSNQYDFHQFLVGYHTDQKDAALQRLESVLRKPDLTSHQRILLADIGVAEGKLKEAIAGYELTANSEYYLSNRQTAIHRILEHAPKIGAWKTAARALIQVGPNRYADDSLIAVDQFFAQVNQEAAEVLSEAASRHAKEFPNNEHTAQLLGLLCEQAEKFGRSIAPRDLGIVTNETTLRSASRWTEFIEDWELTPGRPIKAVWDLKKAPLPSAAAKWTKAPAAATPGYVHLARFLGMSAAESRNNSAFARTTLRSAQARRTTFALGASQCARVFVNGKLVLEALGPNQLAHPNARRFHAQLKAGDNEILVQLGNLDGAWAFCLREIDPSKTLEYARTHTPPARKEATPKTKQARAAITNGFE